MGIVEYIILFILGTCVGSFLNVVTDRIADGESVAKGRSHCDHCHRTLAWYELIPIGSWIIQGGKSRCCGKHLSVQYPLIELITGAGFVVLFRYLLHGSFPSPFSFPPVFAFLFSLMIFSSFLVIFLTDFKYEIIPMDIVGVGVIGVVGFHFAMYTSRFHGEIVPFFTALVPYLLAGAGAFAFFYIIWFISKGKMMGDGDAPLAFFIGFLTGYPGIIVALYWAFLTGAAVGVILILGKKKGLKSHIAFGPFLIIGCAAAILCGNPILSWWRGLW